MDRSDYDTPIEIARKLTKDLMAASRLMDRAQARYLVDNYYAIQAYRISTANQLRSLGAGEPGRVLMWVNDEMTRVENAIKRALGAFAHEYSVGQWMLSQVGIGPVISAGLLSHLDVSKCKTAGHFWRFAGLDPTMVWEKGKPRPWNAALKTLCCHPQTRVITKRGTIRIYSVRIGDQVLTHRGRWRAVTHVIENDFTGSLVHLTCRGLAARGPRLTPNHPVLADKVPVCFYEGEGRERFKVMRSSNPKGMNELASAMIRMRQEGKTLREIGEATGYSQGGVSLIVRGKNRSQANAMYGQDWINASDLRPGWSVKVPVIPDEGFFPSIECQSHFERSPNASRVPTRVELNPEIARFVGLFISEGFASSEGVVQLSFHKDETDFHAHVMSVFKYVFGLGSSLAFNKFDDGCNVTACSSLLAESFNNLFGVYSATKHIPPAWMSMDVTLCRALLRGLFEGDGHYNAKTVSYGTVSPTLAIQIQELLLRCGIVSGLSSRTLPSGDLAYHIEVHDRDLFGKSILCDESVEWKPSKVAKWQPDGVWMQLDPPTTVPYTGPVYNLEVEDDESYVADGIAVHNCAFKMGECFVKTQNRDGAVYGQLYRQRKDAEIAASGEGKFKALAAERADKVGKSTVAYKHYKDGTLPPGHLHARARRFAVKIFLSHLHHVMYFDYFREDPPVPYVFEHCPGDHRHFIDIPNWPWPMTGKSLRDLKEGERVKRKTRDEVQADALAEDDE